MVAGLVLVTGCSGAGDEDAATTLSQPSPASSTVFVPTVAPEDEGLTIQDLEQDWAANRATVAETLSGGSYGVTEEVLSGPGNLQVDLGDCPSGWADDAGLDGGTVKIGLTVAQTGQQAAFGEVALGMRAYFDYVNANGGIGGLPIELLVKDDQNSAASAETAVAELIDEGAFYVSNVGSTGALASYETLNENCVPQPFVVSPHPAFADPSEHPFTTGFELSYVTEALLWGTWIRQNLGEHVPVTVGVLAVNNDYGQMYLDAFTAWADSNLDVIADVSVVRHDPQATDVATEMAELAAEAPDVFVSITTGEACVGAVAETEASGLATTALARFTTLRCSQPSVHMAPAGAAGEGFYAVGAGMKSSIDVAYAEDPFVKFVNDELATTGLPVDSPLIGAGFAQYGWAHVEVLRLAAALPGGLTRTNVVLALRGAELEHPMVLDPVRFATNGVDDAYFIEGAAVRRYEAASGAWVQHAPAIDLNGLSPNCEWSATETRCS